MPASKYAPLNPAHLANTNPSTTRSMHQNGHQPPMDNRQTEYPPPGLTSPYPPFPDQQSEGHSTDPASAQYPQAQDSRAPANFSSSATPTSEYGMPPSSARSGSFNDYMRPYASPAGPGAPGGPMPQSNSPSLPLRPDGQANNHETHNMKSDTEVPIDPSIASASPTYTAPHVYPPYQNPHEMQQHYGPPPHPVVYSRPEWAPGSFQSPHMQQHYHPATTGPPTPSMVSPGHRPPNSHPLSTVYSFVPIPGTTQHKRPRRRYEEIERMYKCGFNGCEKAYGTLNHLNAHVTMQSHGAKRTPEEFKEIRKEWKAKKKEEEALRKAEEERLRQQGEARGATDSSDGPAQGYGQMRSTLGPPPSMGGPQLPPITSAYGPSGQSYTAGTSAQTQQQYATTASMDGMGQYAPTSNHVSGNGGNSYSSYPPPAYGQGGNVYQPPPPQDEKYNNYQQ
ncbi:hypothetical protein EJ06DRAFT_558322 [Trichodelitschia bisporula]|uniref:C2H2-type domain-containing protein n=1 Tax=Trichodelitschia bisporula TaxID=703511 RepID=A0A6G1HRF7_9PEZI|nr:hypothetical protein EJ06DRAFT_558322 [Trichodelitschia bisporula]